MIDIQNIHEACQASKPNTMRAPLILANDWSNSQQEVRLKLETTHSVGAFKLHGAVDAVLKIVTAKVDEISGVGVQSSINFEKQVLINEV